MKHLTMVPLLALLLLGSGCNRSAIPRHPNAIDQLDSNTYDTLIVAQAVLDNAKIAVKQGKIPESAKPIINAGGAAYNAVRDLWLDYRASPSVSLADKIFSAVAELNKIILQLRGLGVEQ